MKWQAVLISILCMSSWTFSSCSSNNNDPLDDGSDFPEKAVQAGFTAKYPNAANVKWEAQGNYRKADFDLGRVEYDAWFSKSGTWLQAEHTITYGELPSAVKLSLDNSINYPPTSWTPDNSVDVVENLNAPAWYAVELKNGGVEVTVWMDAEGNGIKDVSEDYSGSEIPSGIRSFITQKYPNSVTLEADKLMNLSFQATILNGEHVKIVHFDRGQNWEYTSYFVAEADVPQAVLNVLSGEAYADYEIKQIQYQEYPSGNRYHFLLGKPGSVDMTVNIDTEGNVILD